MDYDAIVSGTGFGGTIAGTLSDATGAKYAAFLLWRGIANKKLIIVHPLGGCPIGSPTRTAWWTS